jgi:cellulose synthase/poly-beta-1,6-N-acetylglucosamine synthase-like glycosyltransferase
MDKTLEWLAIVFAAVAALPMTILIAEAAVGFFRIGDKSISGDIPKTCILIPAHNEADIIEKTLTNLISVIPKNVRILVVADNCTDDTASKARALNVEVIERTDETKRGKGYALAFGRDSMSANPPDCVVVLDADCSTDTQSIADIAIWCHRTGSPIQARNILERDLSLSSKVQISNFALWFKNVVRQRGTYRLGGGNMLAGTGMAFPWHLFKGLPLATGDIVEDLALSVDLIKSGRPPLLFEQSTITSPAAPEHATLQQRSRWEHGFMNVAMAHGLPAIAHGVMRRNLRTLILGFHLLVPPLALLIVMEMFFIFTLLCFAIFVNYSEPFIYLTIIFVMMILTVFANWLREGNQWLSARALISLPIYIFWKLPVYWRFLARRTSSWVRTDRG